MVRLMEAVDRVITAMRGIVREPLALGQRLEDHSLSPVGPRSMAGIRGVVEAAQRHPEWRLE
jgi:hypothetical protein